MKNETVRKLAKWGCDMDGAIDRVLGDEDFYVELLNDFINEFDIGSIRRAVERHDVVAAFEHSHDLKGVLANLGLTPVREPVLRIVEVFRAGSLDGVSDDIDLLEKRFDELKKTIG